MDLYLRCNNNKGNCRTELKEQAVVTTCSHIFCLVCAEQLGLTGASARERACPACGAPLPNVDDAVTTHLQPTEEYKTSVLSGLDPTTIMECAGRAMAFWTYQTTQEVMYQEHLCKNLVGKYGNLSASMDRMINEANTEFTALQKQLSGLLVEKQSLRQKNIELVEMYREKTRKHSQTQQLYDTLKKRFMMSQVQTAASESATQTFQSMGAAPRPESYGGPSHSSTLPKNDRNRPVSQIPVDHNGVEQLHTHQRAGSGSVHSGDAAAMPPPNRPRGSYRAPILSDTTHKHRSYLPGNTIRASANRSQIPTRNSRTSSQTQVGSTSNQKLTDHGTKGSNNAHGYGVSTSLRTASTLGGESVEPRFSAYNYQGSGLSGQQVHSRGPFYS